MVAAVAVALSREPLRWRGVIITTGSSVVSTALLFLGGTAVIVSKFKRSALWLVVVRGVVLVVLFSVSW